MANTNTAGKFAVIGRQGTFRHSTKVTACFEDAGSAKVFARRGLLAIRYSSRFSDDPQFCTGEVIYADQLHRGYFPRVGKR